MANFSGIPALTITVHYSPIEGNLEAEDHYDHLTAAVSEIPKHNMLIVTGDFNSHLCYRIFLSQHMQLQWKTGKKRL